MKMIKKTKITATLGPSITGKIFTLADFNKPENKGVIETAKKNLAALFDAGVNVVRFNFSHGDYEEQTIRLNLVREVAKEKGVNISTMLDTKGPEIRVYKTSEKEVEIKSDSKVRIYTTKKEIGTSEKFSVLDSTGTYNMAKDVQPGNTIFVDDGKLKLEVISSNVEEGIIETIARNTWILRENKRINLPDSNYSIPFMSDKDRNDIIFAIKNKFDYIAASFVNTGDNVREIKKILKEHGGEHIQIISKIETMTGIKSLDDIIDESDSIMVARGDLGLEVPYYDVPTYEKYIIKDCRHKGKTVIVATQMLDSLETKIQPTRAEVTDVFFAVERGTDCTMLSGETANGMYPINAVEVMAKIDVSSENFFDYGRAIDVYFKETPFMKEKVGTLATTIATLVAPKRVIDNHGFDYSSIVVFGNDTRLIQALSNIRCAAPIFFVTDKKEYATRFGLNYGVFVKVVDNVEHAIANKTEIIDAINSQLPEVKKTVVVINDSIYKH
ncbi:pyruvate kinase [Malacoplasma penetrans]|uniref:Pyruvate kinase n=1 Tax=Malacoplasma penetrans (strain HF-2) TaxID=272633 RepID=Q8EWX2_MALP2|nr:pyruvate kinase [Malacoplasma penetrans]RXY97344.1 pyruvate kinase [Malacoplasma penetrans]BAC43868.1 pyruvate kinase [Malacoplasma penetrans HF-2]